MRQEEVPIWPQLSWAYLEVDCPSHPASCQTRGHYAPIIGRAQGEGFLGEKVKSRGEECSFPIDKKCPESGLFLPHSLFSPCVSPPNSIACTIPPSRNVLCDTYPKPSHFTSRFKFLHLQEAFFNWNINKNKCEVLHLGSRTTGCGLTYLMRGSQSTFLESGFCVR